MTPEQLLEKGYIKICPKCENITCFLLPYFNCDDGSIGDKMCPSCIGKLIKSRKENDEDR